MSRPAAIRVFLADDHAIIREGLTQLLEMHSDLMVVGASAGGPDTLERILALRPDVAVLDISMPCQNGIDIAAQIVRRAPSVAVVILSMHDAPEFVFRALEIGAKGYLQKESAASEISDAIHAVHAGRRYLSTKIAGVIADQVGKPTGKSPLQSLSAREREVLQLVAEGHSSAWIGERLHLSPKTVDTYRSRLMHKLGVADVISLVKFALRHGLISLQS